MGADRNLLVTAQTAALLAHTHERLEYELERSQLWRTLLAIGEIDDALAAFAQERELYDLSTETAQIIVHLAKKHEFGRSLARNFISKLPKKLEDVDVEYVVAVGELLSVYAPNPASILAQWIGSEPDPNTGFRSYVRIDLGTDLLPKALKNLYIFGRWDILGKLEELLPLQVGWNSRKAVWLLENIKLETEFRPNTIHSHVRKAVCDIQNQDERILLAGHVAQHDLGTDIVEELLNGIILHPQLERKSWSSLRSQEFEVFRAYLAGLEYLGRYDEIKNQDNYLKTSNSSVAAYYKACFLVSTSKNSPDKLLSALTYLSEHEPRKGEYMVDIKMAVAGDFYSLLTDLVKRYLKSGGNVELLLEHFCHASKGKTLSIETSLGLRVFSEFSEIRGYLQGLLEDVYDRIINTNLETQSRTNELLWISELAAKCGHFNLGRTWLDEAVVALRGYGYSKDSTVEQLIEALEEVTILQPELFQQRVADIAEWNLLMPQVTEDGKGFPISLYDTTLKHNPDIARELLLTYYDHVDSWKFSEVLTSFICSYKDKNLTLAYTLSELIHENGSQYDNYKDRFKARFHLLNVAVDKQNHNLVNWLSNRIRQFLLTEVPPTERLPFIKEFNKYALENKIGSIQSYSTYQKTDLSGRSKPNLNLDLPEKVELGGTEIPIDALVQKLSVSLDTLSQGIKELLKKYKDYELKTFFKQAIEQLIHKTREISKLDQIADYLNHNNSIGNEGLVLLANAYLNLGRSDKSAESYVKAIMDENNYRQLNPQKQEFKKLAEINPSLAFQTLFDYIDHRNHLWGGVSTFVLFLKGTLVLGKDYDKNAVELYEAFHEFVGNQFKHLPKILPSPYSWLREANHQIPSFEKVAQILIEKTWISPLLHRREHLVHLLRDLALHEPTSTIPWLIGLLQHEDYTLNTQSALVISSIAVSKPELLINYVDSLITALELPHTERNYYLKTALNAVANYHRDDRITNKLESLKSCLTAKSLVLLPNTLRPSRI